MVLPRQAELAAGVGHCLAGGGRTGLLVRISVADLMQHDKTVVISTAQDAKT